MALCIDDELLLAIAEGYRDFDQATESHLARCDDCRRVFASAARSRGEHRGEQSRGEAALPPDDEPSWDELGAGVVVATRYELQRFLGSGAMGVVWAACDRVTGDHVAIKIARGLDADLAQRFAREAEITSTLDHPSIAPTLAFVPGAEARGPCIVMPLLEGETLEARLHRPPTLSTSEACSLLADVAGALATTHARGIVHRDLKPQNVFLTNDRAVVLDFGIAKLLPQWGHDPRLTRSGAVLGTMTYMAPEQLFGERDIDARADVWALGMMLLRCLTNRSPFGDGSRATVLRALRRTPLVATADLAPLPTALRTVLSRMLVVRRDERLGDVLTVLGALRELAPPRATR